jgi:hypothetical protein
MQKIKKNIIIYLILFILNTYMYIMIFPIVCKVKRLNLKCNNWNQSTVIYFRHKRFTDNDRDQQTYGADPEMTRNGHKFFFPM